MNRGLYGYSLPPSTATRVAPPKWTNVRSYLLNGTYTFVVPQNTFQILAMVWGAGGSGGAYTSGSYISGGGGGGFAMGIIDVAPGQALPTLTVGAGGAAVTSGNNGNAGGTSSIGTILTATGGGAGNYSSPTAVAGGAGSITGNLRNAFTASGGAPLTGSSDMGTGGGGSGSPFGVGGTSGSGVTSSSATGGGGWGGNGGAASSAIGTGGGGLFSAANISASGGGGRRGLLQAMQIIHRVEILQAGLIISAVQWLVQAARGAPLRSAGLISPTTRFSVAAAVAAVCFPAEHL